MLTKVRTITKSDLNTPRPPPIYFYFMSGSRKAQVTEASIPYIQCLNFVSGRASGIYNHLLFCGFFIKGKYILL